MYQNICQILREKEQAFELRKKKEKKMHLKPKSRRYSKPNNLQNGRAKHLQINTFFGVAILRLIRIKNIVHLLSEEIQKK